MLRFMIPAVLVTSMVYAQDDPVFSGPQVDEPLPALPIEQIFDEEADGKTIDLTSETPTVLVFVHKLTRPSVAFTRTLMKYAATRKDDGLKAGLIFLGDDQTALKNRLSRAKHALPLEVVIGISPDGVEGPGAFGLNRDVTLTVLVANKKTVTFNQALVDPNIPVELPKTLVAICDQIGGEPPKLERLMQGGRMNQRRPTAPSRQPKEPR